MPALRADRRGYVLDGSHDGFADRPALSGEARRRLARWARRFTPETLTDEQRALLEAPPAPRSESDDDLLAAVLADAEDDVPATATRGFYDDLTREQLEIVYDAGGRGYPIKIGELEALTGATARQLRHWEALGLLPAHRVDGQRRYFGAAVARAFALKASSQYEIAALGELAGGGPDAARFTRLVAGEIAGLAAGVADDAAQELRAAAAALVRHSRRLAEQTAPKVPQTKAVRIVVSPKSGGRGWTVTHGRRVIGTHRTKAEAVAAAKRAADTSGAELVVKPAARRGAAARPRRRATGSSTS